MLVSRPVEELLMNTTTHWRPQVLWLPMGGLLGAMAGAATGAVLMVVAPLADDVSATDRDGPVLALVGAIAALVVIGVWFGGIAGLVVGLFVGVELMFLVGAHLPREVARRRAYRWGFVLPPVTMVVAVVVWSGGDVSFDGPDVGTLLLLASGSLSGGPLARWLAGWQPPRPPVS
ncbi:hypothetical protein ASG76_08210 [Nocardioides sp. Soil774]|nr:hypothetical protein ASG76_08210 [Nocardioides sp. Soil774]